MRLYSYLKNNANLTKSEVTKLYNESRITVNHEKKNLSYIIRDGDFICIDEEEIKEVEYKYYIYNKPIGVVCTNNTLVNNNIKDITNINERVYPVGRLDKDSHGLIILTNDGKFTNYVIGRDSHIEKEYVVRVEKRINNIFIESIQKRVLLNNKLTLENKSYLIDDYTFGIILREGMYHQIKKIVRMNNNKVIDLKRIRIGNIKIDILENKNINLMEIANIKEII